MEAEHTIFPEEIPVVYASFWERFGAAFLDGMILAAVNFLISLFWGGNMVYKDDSFSFSWSINTNLWGSLISVVAGWLYAALQESSAAQATLGKRALGIKVTNMEGGRISFLQATGRHFGKFISTLIFCIGYLMMLWDSKKQTLHDKMAGTLVVGS